MTRSYRIASVPADGIGPEVIAAGLEVLDAVASKRRRIHARDRPLRLGLRLVSQARRVHAGRRAGLAAHRRCDLFRRGRRSEHSGPHLALGPAAADLPGLRPIRQRPPDPHPARRDLAAARCRPGRPGLGDRAGELGRRVRRPGRAHPSRPARGSGHRDRHLHPPRRRADHALRLRHRPLPPAQAPDGGDQVERPAPRHGVLGRDREPRSATTTRT